MGTWKKMDFWEQRELGKNGFRETWEGVGNDQKKIYAPAKCSDPSMSVTLVLYSIPVSDSRIPFRLSKSGIFL